MARKFKFLKVIGKEDAEILENLGYRLLHTDGETYTFENNLKLNFDGNDVVNRIVFSDVLVY